ncbi:hypothetical protein EJB10_02525 [Wolbachia endosymbiont of Brugia malayi]|uniref:hypothetical protein n=1 Tax=Wolbachia endosymbiont of Brugia malayi TaxID=80849 RepID=UPI00004C9270|nr:hypothetical protein [Wolbachia endosymbiont of Brugia malayi]AAW70687.1 Predicted protein [Wolbachia endosymbiont strain TRS of Brugia malayi]QCB61669.1 hypothetical protein EJB10_02525 [Wolbachia endosymbiont of Brugia malayi]
MVQFLKENRAKRSLEIDSTVITLAIITLSLALVVYSVIKGVQKVAAKKTDNILSEVESQKVVSPRQKV